MTNENDSQVQGEQSPIEKVLQALGSYQDRGRYYIARCPAHNDGSPSLSVWEDERHNVGVKCFAGCSWEAIVEALNLAKSDLFKNGPAKHAPKDPHAKLEVLDLAVDKLIRPDALFNYGITEGYKHRTPKGTVSVVKIPYYTADGKEYSRYRIRTALSAKEGSAWNGDSKDPLIPYGRHKLHEARLKNMLYIVEGESDCWTLWLHKYPALGIPGATNEACLQKEDVEGIEQIYVIQENDAAGEQFPQRVYKRLQKIGYTGKVYAVTLADAKDPNDLHKRDYKNFAGNLDSSTVQARAVTEKVNNIDIDALIEQVAADRDLEAAYDLANVIVQLPEASIGLAVERLAAAMKKAKVEGFKKTYLNKCIKEAQSKRKRESRQRVSNLAMIQINDMQDRDIVRLALEELHKHNKKEGDAKKKLFSSKGRLVRVAVDERGIPSIDGMSDISLHSRLMQVADYMTVDGEGNIRNVPVPKIIAKVILADNASDFTPLDEITEVPTIRSDGSIFDTPGYDEMTGRLYIPNKDLTLPKIERFPTQEQAKEALKYIESFICDFPFAEEAGKPNTIALWLTTVTRQNFGPVPMVLIDGTKPGTGKGLLTNGTALIATGRTAQSMTEVTDDDEWRKTIHSLLMRGPSMICIDNVEHPLGSGVLATYIAEEHKSERVLGSSAHADVNTNVLWIANGNNIQLAGDMRRRCYSIRIDSGLSRPDQRENFTRKDLLDDIKKERGEIVAALLTIVRAWYAAGQPKAVNRPKPMATFSQWLYTMADILDFVGLSGFMGDQKRLYESTDTEESDWTKFLEVWQEQLKGNAYKISDIKDILNDFTSQSGRILRGVLPDKLATIAAEKPATLHLRLGKELKRRMNTPYGEKNLKIINGTRDAHSKQDTYRVVSATSNDAATLYEEEI